MPTKFFSISESSFFIFESIYSPSIFNLNFNSVLVIKNSSLVSSIYFGIVILTPGTKTKSEDCAINLLELFVTNPS